MSARLYYVHDPMCSWCWGFSRVWAQIQEQLSGINIQLVLGGLAPDSNEPMPTSMQLQLQQYWQRIEQVIPGTRFNYDFWTQNSPRRSTYPACRAVIAAKAQDEHFELPMINAIQHAYYLNAKNPSDDSTLVDLANDIGCDPQVFAQALSDDQTQQSLLNQIHFARRLGAQGFPSLFLETESASVHQIAFDYNDYTVAVDNISHWLAS